MAHKDETIKKVRETIVGYRMLEKGQRVIVAVSGGPDSVCLLDILNTLREEFRSSLVVAHYDHGLRPREDADETRFVHDLAHSMNLPFVKERGGLSAYGDSPSLEERARDARYAFLEKVRIGRRAQKIALGHTLTDQAETVLMRLMRGSGPTGLAGIPPVRDGVFIRPLIGVKREQILSYLKVRDLPYVTDSSNLQTRFLRNEIRLAWMPLLLKGQPRLVEHLGGLAEILRQENEYMERQAAEWVAHLAEETPDRAVSLPVAAFLELPPALRNRVTRCLLKRVKKDLRRVGQAHIRAVHALAAGNRPQSHLHFPRGLRIRKTYDRLIISRSGLREYPVFHYLLEGPGDTALPEIGCVITLLPLRRGPEQVTDAPPDTAYLDMDKLRFPLVLRNVRPGDRFVPLGMKGRKKVKDFFMDLKIPSRKRASTPILLSEGTPVWICGLRIDDRFKVTPEAKNILRVTLV